MKVNTQAMLEQANHYKSIIEDLLEVRQSLQQVMRQLNNQKSLAQIRPALEGQCARVEQHALDLVHLQQALEEILKLYTQTETELADHVEQAQISYPRQPIGYITIPGANREGNLLDRPPTATR